MVLAPSPTPETASCWAAAGRGRILLERCRADGTVFLYPQKHPRCPQCGGDQVDPLEAAGTGSLYSYVVNQIPIPGVVDAPTVIGLVELDEGVRIVAQVRDVSPEPGQIPLDMRLAARFESVGDHSLPYFVPEEGR